MVKLSRTTFSFFARLAFAAGLVVAAGLAVSAGARAVGFFSLASVAFVFGFVFDFVAGAEDAPAMGLATAFFAGFFTPPDAGAAAFDRVFVAVFVAGFSSFATAFLGASTALVAGASILGVLIFSPLDVEKTVYTVLSRDECCRGSRTWADVYQGSSCR
ncbi:hypothetical protein P9250_22465 [Caballeronia sp. LP006]|uniref:hypothetical protein n=1 Tax=Caballeronia sp. LP006 TaxID=3038552 RepID=UPI0028670795|nr:hypothetical protein [Caballeronia sp. LP006]MDR5830641.1 hypothetical protein [Caballeronia sp. LP006]